MSLNAFRFCKRHISHHFQNVPASRERNAVYDFAKIQHLSRKQFKSSLTEEEVRHFDKQSSNVSVTTRNKGLRLFVSLARTFSNI